MRQIMIALLFMAPLAVNAQFVGLNVAYDYNTPVKSGWKPGHGFAFGIGSEGIELGSSSLVLGTRYLLSYHKSQYAGRLDSVQFDVPEGINDMGYAQTTFKKLSFGLEYDLGYQSWEYSVVQPYVSLGIKYNNHSGDVMYDLYFTDTCDCSTTEEITNTQSLGFTSALGVKLKVSDNVYFDFRASYGGAWGLKRSDDLFVPDVESFHIDPYGNPAMNNSANRYNQNFNFRVGIVVNMFSGGGSASSSSYDSDDDDWDSSSDDSYDSDDSGGSSSGSSGNCFELKPSGRGGG